MAMRKQYPKNVPVEVMDKNSDGSWRQIPQLVYVREVPAAIPNTTATLRQWAKVLATEVKNQGAQYPVELGFGRDMTVLDENNELQSLDTVLMDDNVVSLVKKRYRKTLKKTMENHSFLDLNCANILEQEEMLEKYELCLVNI